jgi:hypothetical protein
MQENGIEVWDGIGGKESDCFDTLAVLMRGLQGLKVEISSLLPKYQG